MSTHGIYMYTYLIMRLKTIADNFMCIKTNSDSEQKVCILEGTITFSNYNEQRSFSYPGSTLCGINKEFYFIKL